MPSLAILLKAAQRPGSRTDRTSGSAAALRFDIDSSSQVVSGSELGAWQRSGFL